MIKNTFCFLDGIGTQKEQQLWLMGIHDWDSFVKTRRIPGISAEKKLIHDLHIRKAAKAVLNDTFSYFSHLPKAETWRLFPYIQQSLYIDVEADARGNITCITIYDGQDIQTFIQGHTLDNKQVQNILDKYFLIITFNGGSYDIPLLKKRGIHINALHWDLRHSCARLGYTGGLKAIEKRHGIHRSRLVEELRGGDPLKLWKTYRATADPHYLELLAEYNQEDTINLETIAWKIYRKMHEEQLKFFKEHHITVQHG